jgi:hypothetical protein
MLEAHYNADEGHALVDRLTDIGGYMAESGKLKADAEWHYHAKINAEIMRMIRELLPDYTSASVQNAFCKSLAKEEAHLVSFAERVNRTCTHQVEAMRSQLSYVKEQAKMI